VATIAVLHQLHLPIDKLKLKDVDIVYSPSNHVTYMRILDHTARVNISVVANESSIVRDFVTRSHDRFGDTTRDTLWLNMTIQSQSEI